MLLRAQAPDPTAELSPKGWIEAAAQNEIHIIDDDGTFPVRYRIRRVDAKGDVTREVIECKEGTVGRLVQRNGQSLTREEDAAERDRLSAILADPGSFLKHQSRNLAARKYAVELVKQIPAAMLYTYTPGQPQPQGAGTPQVVLDFRPDPKFKPSSATAQLLTGLEGRMWIDKRSLRLTRLEGRVIQPVNFGWGVLAHVYPGGTVEFEQIEAGQGRWVYSSLNENITIREMLLKTANERSLMSASDVQLLPAPLSYRDAIQDLLSIQIPLR